MCDDRFEANIRQIIIIAPAVVTGTEVFIVKEKIKTAKTRNITAFAILKTLRYMLFISLFSSVICSKIII